MSELDDLTHFSLDCINDACMSALAQLRVDVVDQARLTANTAQLRFAGAPSYLPLATLDSEIVAIHLLPGRPLKRSPLVCFASGSRSPDFMCKDLRTFPRALWIWLAAYYKSRISLFREAIEGVVQEIEGALAIPATLWELLVQAPLGQPQRWNYGAKTSTVEAWRIADTGHPFVELSDLDCDDASDARAELIRFIQRTPNPAPQVLSAFIDASVESGAPTSREAVLGVLHSEAWLGGEAAFRTTWASVEPGLGEWSKALRIALDKPEMIEASPFQRLFEHPETYSGADKKGPPLLVAVADDFASVGELQTALHQLRNSASVSLEAKGGFGRELCYKIGELSDRIECNSAAASLARFAAEIDMKDI